MNNDKKSWFKSSRSNGQDGACVEVRFHAQGTDMRDTKDRDGGHLSLTQEEWSAFIGRVRNPS